MRAGSAVAHTLTGYRLLELGLARLEQTQVTLDKLQIEDSGRPCLPGGPSFSISHSRGWVGCAIAVGCQVGLDIERIRAIQNPKLMRFLTPEQVSACADDASVFFKDWTAREATVKATGKVGLARIAQVVIATETSVIDDQCWHLRYPAMHPDYVACLAYNENNAELLIQDFSAEIL